MRMVMVRPVEGVAGVEVAVVLAIMVRVRFPFES